MHEHTRGVARPIGRSTATSPARTPREMTPREMSPREMSSAQRADQEMRRRQEVLERQRREEAARKARELEERQKEEAARRAEQESRQRAAREVAAREALRKQAEMRQRVVDERNAQEALRQAEREAAAREAERERAKQLEQAAKEEAERRRRQAKESFMEAMAERDRRIAWRRAQEEQAEKRRQEEEAAQRRREGLKRRLEREEEAQAVEPGEHTRQFLQRAHKELSQAVATQKTGPQEEEDSALPPASLEVCDQVLHALKALRPECVTIGVLKATNLGRLVASLRKHEKLRNLARDITTEWKAIVSREAERNRELRESGKGDADGAPREPDASFSATHGSPSENKGLQQASAGGSTAATQQEATGGRGSKRGRGNVEDHGQSAGENRPAETGRAPDSTGHRSSRRRRGGDDDDDHPHGDEDFPELNISAREIRALSEPATTLHVPGKDAHVGDRVKARYLASKHGAAGTMWYQGKVVAENADDDTVDVRFDDGDFEEHVHRMYVRPM